MPLAGDALRPKLGSVRFLTRPLKGLFAGALLLLGGDVWAARPWGDLLANFWGSDGAFDTLGQAALAAGLDQAVANRFGTKNVVLEGTEFCYSSEVFSSCVAGFQLEQIKVVGGSVQTLKTLVYGRYITGHADHPLPPDLQAATARKAAETFLERLSAGTPP